jgi:NhaA family Na+:H+ antiporter
VGGLLLIVAAAVGIVWANSRWDEAYHDLITWTFGPSSLHLHLSVEEWAADGLLAIFFFVAGLELKREFVAGDLRDPRVAAVPVAAAIGGVVVPALVYVVVTHGHGVLDGWAIPTATDIAFALAVLAVIGSALPPALRTFLLTLAVVDDLIAIVVIACFYTDHLRIGLFLVALVAVAAFGFLAQRGVRRWWLLAPIALVAWALVHASGVHATVAGVMLALTVPAAEGARNASAAEAMEHWWRPVSAGLAVPVFALTSAGVHLGGWDGFVSALGDRVAVGIVLALVVGKTIGVFGATYVVARFTRAELDDELSWIDVFGLAILGGIGFTVSLLIATLAFGEGTTEVAHAKIAVFCGSLAAAVLASVVLRLRNQVYRRIRQEEQVDADDNHVPDVYDRER